MSKNRIQNVQRSPSLSGIAWLAICLIAASFFAWRGSNRSLASSELPGAAAVTKSIENIQAGERVAFAENPAESFDDSLGEVVDPASWRMLRLRVDKESIQAVDVVLLRPEWWIKQRLNLDAQELTLSVPEVGIYGAASVLSVEQCPPIRSGRGRVVIGTFKHISPSRVELHVEGLSDPIRCTPDHPTWSPDRQEFIDAQDFQPGDLVQGASGLHRVLRIVRVAQPVSVFNLEVHGQHVYQVSTLGVLVHNAPSNPAAYEANIQRNKHARQGRPMSFDDAVDEVANGGDVFANGKDTARNIAGQAGDGPPVHDLPHGPGQAPHYHPTIGGERAPGHVLY